MDYLSQTWRLSDSDGDYKRKGGLWAEGEYTCMSLPSKYCTLTRCWLADVSLNMGAVGEGRGFKSAKPGVDNSVMCMFDVCALCIVFSSKTVSRGIKFFFSSEPCLYFICCTLLADKLHRTRLILCDDLGLFIFFFVVFYLSYFAGF